MSVNIYIIIRYSFVDIVNLELLSCCKRDVRGQIVSDAVSLHRSTSDLALISIYCCDLVSLT